MSPTTKILLGAGATGIAVYLLWRLWPKDEVPAPSEPLPKTPPITVTPGPSYTPTTPVTTPKAPVTYVPPQTQQLSLITCPDGTYLYQGECVPLYIE